ncbi:MAG: WXG100 family type VII secretion target [Pseudonocardiaceae bacterium]
MPGWFVVDLEQLDGVVSRLAAFEQTLERRIADVDARVQGVHGVWSGDAAAAQLAAHREWLAGAGRMRTALAEITAAATTAHANYSAAVAANKRMWS